MISDKKSDVEKWEKYFELIWLGGIDKIGVNNKQKKREQNRNEKEGEGEERGEMSRNWNEMLHFHDSIIHFTPGERWLLRWGYVNSSINFQNFLLFNISENTMTRRLY